jgi:hypothetical protein
MLGPTINNPRKETAQPRATAYWANRSKFREQAFSLSGGALQEARA